MLDIQVEDLPQENQKPETTSKPVSSTVVSPLGSLELLRYFNIDYPTTEEKQKLDELWAYARSLVPEGSLEEVFSEVLRLKGVVGSPRLGEAHLDRIYRYIKLRKQEKLIKQEIADVQGSANL